ncbi:hypothetical protein BDL97_17G048800 [Sphagnum fallax]|nr:hypothetical protein BDL97_17G048800 [Sphagnum fallax]
MKLLRFVSGFKSHQQRRCWWWLHSPKEWSRCLQTIFGYFGLLSCHQQPISGTSVGSIEVFWNFWGGISTIVVA